MANLWENVDMIAAEALIGLKDALIIAPLCSSDKTAEFNNRPNGYRVGDEIRIKTRPVYQTTEFTAGGSVTKQAIRESHRTMTIEKHLDISVEIGAKEKALDLESFSSQVIIPAVQTLAESCDQHVGTKILQGRGLHTSTVSAPGLYATAADMANARKVSTIQQLDPSGRYNLVDLDLEAQLLGADYFIQSQHRGTEGPVAFNRGYLNTALGMDFFSSINFPALGAHTVGSGAGATNNGVGNLVGESTLIYDGGSGTFLAGDRIEVAGVRRPMIVKTDTTGVTGSIPLVDPIDELIPDSAAITTIGVAAKAQTYKGAIFDNSSLAVAMPILDTPSDKPASVASSDGYSVRVVQGYDMTTKTELLSIDLLIGAIAYDTRRITLLASETA